MKNWFKFCLTCLGIAILLRLAFEAVTGQSEGMPKALADRHAYIMPGKVAVEWHFRDEFRIWLSINSSNSRDWPEEGFHPSHTHVLVKDCVPVVRKLAENKYEIAFRSEIAKDLP